MVALCLACGSSSVTLDLHNVGTEPLIDVVVHTTGRKYEVGELRPDERRSLRVCADDDSDIFVEHGRGAARRRYGLEVYLDHHCTGSVTAQISPDSLVSRQWKP